MPEALQFFFLFSETKMINHLATYIDSYDHGTHRVTRYFWHSMASTYLGIYFPGYIPINNFFSYTLMWVCPYLGRYPFGVSMGRLVGR
jgi:hypothetical protein